MSRVIAGADGAVGSLQSLLEGALEAERFSHAVEQAKSIDLSLLPPSERDGLMPLMLRCRSLGGEPVDRVILEARSLLATTTEARSRALIRGEVALGLVRKRVQGLARAELEAMEQEWPEGSAAPAMRGWLALQFDCRDEALEAYREATNRQEPWRGFRGLAHVHWVIGDFDGALAILAESGRDSEVSALRLKADIALVRGNWEEELELLDAILERTLQGDRRRWDLLSRASTLMAMNRRELAFELYREIWRSVETDGPGRFARHVMNHVERNGTGARVMLGQFPTVTQKRNYCGPACLELLLRAQGIEVFQDEIAEQVKKGQGSSILAMTNYLESHGLSTRRFEATNERLKACLELHLPVILEEEYSTTSHVAVLMGIDESLGLLFLQDPMTHLTTERTFDVQERLGALYRNAAIVAVRRGDAQTLAALDAAGVTDQAHLRLVDRVSECSDPRDVIARCDEALALVDDYPLAWYHRTEALLSIWGRYRSPFNHERFLAELRGVRVRYPLQEWSHLIHGHYLMASGRWEEALIEWEAALAIDPGDSNTVQSIAECHMKLQRSSEAADAFWRTLRLDASNVRANENFASLARDLGETELAGHLSACALELAPQNPFNHLTAALVAYEQGQRAKAIAHARRSVEVDPDYAAGALRLAAYLAESAEPGEREEATRIYRDLSARYPQWFEPRIQAARCLEREGRVEEAAVLLIGGLDIAENEPVDLLKALGQILIEAGEFDRAVELAERYAKARPTSRMLGQWWNILDDVSRHADSAAATASYLASHPEDAWASAMYASRVAGRGGEHDVEAERLLRHVLTVAPDYGFARCELAQLLVRDRAEEALELVKDRPGELLQQVQVLLDMERFEEARKILESQPTPPSWYAQELWNRAVLGSLDANAACDLLAAVSEPALRDQRAHLAFAIAAERWREAATLFEQIPADDALAETMARTAASADDAFRPELERRIQARLADVHLSHGQRRFFEAVLDGNRAALGDRSAFDARLAHEKNPNRLDNMTASFGPRQRELTALVTERMARFEGCYTGLIEALQQASRCGESEKAVEFARKALALSPRSHFAWALLIVEELTMGDIDAAIEAAELARKLVDPWVTPLYAVGLVALITGDRELAEDRARRARRKVIGSGYCPHVFPLLGGLEGALAQDPSMVEAFRRFEVPGRCQGLWERLLAIAKGG